MTTTLPGNKIKVVGVRNFLRDFSTLTEQATQSGVNLVIQKDGQDIGTFTPVLKKKKYTIKDLMNFRIKPKKGQKIDKNLSQNIDKYVYGY